MLKKFLFIMVIVCFAAACGSKEPRPETGKALLAQFGGTEDSETAKRVGELAQRVQDLEKDMSVVDRRNAAITEKYDQIIDLFKEYQKTLNILTSKIDSMTKVRVLAYSAKDITLYGSADASSAQLMKLPANSMFEILEGDAGSAAWIKVLSGSTVGYIDGRSAVLLKN